MTATMAVMLLAAIFMPIVHKTSLKRRSAGKKINNLLIVRELLILLRYTFI
jgi:hypothetical protein